MKFLVDAQLPRRLAHALTGAGFEAVHTLDLPNGNRTSDGEISRIAEIDNRVVVTKDADFVHSHLILGLPSRLCLIATGNITNAALEALIVSNLPALVSALETASFVELSRTSLIVHA